MLVLDKDGNPIGPEHTDFFFISKPGSRSSPLLVSYVPCAGCRPETTCSACSTLICLMPGARVTMYPGAMISGRIHSDGRRLCSTSAT